MTAPDPDDGPAVRPMVRPAERYGDRSRSPWAVAAVIALATIFVGGVVAIGWRFSNPEFTTRLIAYDVVDDASVRVEYVVSTRDPDGTVTCVVRARDRLGNEVGRREVETRPGAEQATITVTLRTTVRAVVGEIQECRLDADG